MKHFNIITLGCKVNQCESDSLGAVLQEAGWWPAPDGWPADVCIINTCAVTGKASMQSRQAVRRIIRSNATACIVVTGCCAQTESHAFREIEGIHLIVGHGEKHRIVDLIDEYLRDQTSFASAKRAAEDAPSIGGRPQPLMSGIRMPDAVIPKIVMSDVRHVDGFKPVPGIPNGGHRSRPSLKIQDGCDAFCTYCIVPYARGRSRSMPVAEVLANLSKLVAAGFREVVLSGIHLGCYGRDLVPRTNLLELLRRIEERTSIDRGHRPGPNRKNDHKISRIRLSSIEPLELTPEIIDLVAGSACFCPHFHVPLQSGDNDVLKRMHRPYTREVFRDVVLAVRDKIPHAALGADVLIGFPGESEEAFAGTHDFLRDLPVSYLHVFPFSPRKGTPAAAYPDPVPAGVAKDRCRRMRELGDQKRKSFYRAVLGKTVAVLVEKERDGETGLLKGVSSCYRTVLMEGDDGLKNQVVQAVVERVWPGRLAIGRLVDGRVARQNLPENS